MPRARPTASEQLLAAGCAVLALSALALPFRSAPAVYGYPLIEDGYYALTVAGHLSRHQGFSADGVHATGGVQPLWVILLSGVSWIARAGREGLVRLALAVEVLLYFAAAVLVGLLAARVAAATARPPRRAAVLAVLVYLSSASIFEDHFNGLETGLTLCLYAASGLLLLKMDWRRWTHVFALGVAYGVLILTRVDAVFFAALTVAIVVRPKDVGSLEQWAARAIAVPAVAAVVSSPWFLYNKVVFGHFTPSGGLAQAADSFSKGRLFVASLVTAGRLMPLSIDVLSPSSYAAVAAVGVALVCAVIATKRLVREHARTLASSREGRVLALLLANAVVLAFWYGATSRAWWMYSRYAAPAVLVTIPLAAAVLARFEGRAAAVAHMLLLTLCISGAAYTRYSARAAVLRQRPHLLLVEAVARAVPPADQVGALQSGTLGYFRDRVVNLDGKVNERALAHHADLLRYCDQEKIGWLADWPFLLERDVFHGSAPRDWRLAYHLQVPNCDPCNWVVFRKAAD